MLFLIVSEEAVQVSTGESNKLHQYPGGKVHAETYRKLQKAGPNKASSVNFLKVGLNVWTQGVSASSAAERLLPLALTCYLTTHLTHPATRAVGSPSPHFIEEKLRQSQGRQ